LLITNVPSGRICCRHRPTPSRGAPDRDAGPSTRKDGPDLLPTGFSSHDKSPARRLLPVRVLIQIFCGLQSRVVPIPGPDHVLFESVYHLLLGHDEPAYAKQDEKWDSLVPASGQVQLDRVQRRGRQRAATYNDSSFTRIAPDVPATAAVPGTTTMFKKPRSRCRSYPTDYSYPIVPADRSSANIPTRPCPQTLSRLAQLPRQFGVAPTAKRP
jgi:hypothetical protein